MGRVFWVGLLLAGVTGVGMAQSPSSSGPKLNGPYEATAYAQKGLTASGQLVHRHVVAADPDVLPIGSRIKIRHAGPYSGEYVVADTGDKIQGRRLDIYLPSAVACKKFGTKMVTVRVIQVGDGTHAAAKQADVAVKQDVKKDVAKNVVGNAATAADLPAAKAAAKVGATANGGTAPAGSTQAGTTGNRSGTPQQD